VGTKCSPSYALHAGLAAADSNSEAETGLIARALLRGWAVVAADYEGPHSQFAGAAREAHGVLDGIRAALIFAPAGFSWRTPVALWGYSGGALASSLAAQLQAVYAPELKFAGIALGGEVGDLKATFTGLQRLGFRRRDRGRLHRAGPLVPGCESPAAPARRRQPSDGRQSDRLPRRRGRSVSVPERVEV
jgi:Secretory lipase